uniref:S1C family serine protease n=1 Tax=Acetatifactor sp. TaxID=1872090 RepID=UPI004057708D
MYENDNYSGYSTYQTGNTSAFSNSSDQLNGYHNSNPKNNKKGGSFFKKMLVSISLGLVFGLVAGFGFYGVQQGMNLLQIMSGRDAVVESSSNVNADMESESDIKLTNTNNITVIQSDVSDMVEEVMPAMVSIVNNYTETVNFFGQTFTQEQPSSGSGIIVAQNETELLIVSNYHVIADATSLEVTFIDGNTAEAKVKGTDADMDLAVVAVSLDSLSGETKDAISVATLGDSDTLRLGEPVIAIGNALGYGQSVTNGIVSALNREMTLSDGSTGTFIQTNAAINPGNSGGALLNINGEVIGINSNKIGGDVIEGMGYAIPISSASPIISDLMERQTRDKVEEEERGYIGITLQVVTGQNAQMYNMPMGIYVISVEEGSGAEAAGIVPGDIITRFDGEKISTYDDLQELLQYYAVGDTAEITIMRLERGQYVEHEYEITLGGKPTDLQ